MEPQQPVAPNTQQRVRRVRVFPDNEEFDSAIYDLTAADDDHLVENCGFVNMVQASACQLQQQACWFFMGLADCQRVELEPHNLPTFDLTAVSRLMSLPSPFPQKLPLSLCWPCPCRCNKFCHFHARRAVSNLSTRAMVAAWPLLRQNPLWLREKSDTETCTFK